MVLAVLLSACNVDTTVSVRMREDGSGAVRLDAHLDPAAVAATEVGGGKLESRIRLDDLTSAGWKVRPWERLPDGSARLSLSKPFQRPSQVDDVLAELSGPEGPLRDMRFSRDRSVFSTEFSARGLVDLEAVGTGIQNDPELAAALGAQRIDVAALDQSLLDQIHKALTVRTTVELPGERARTVVAAPGSRVELAFSSRVTDTRRVVLTIVAIVLLGAALVVVLLGRRERRT